MIESENSTIGIYSAEHVNGELIEEHRWIELPAENGGILFVNYSSLNEYVVMFYYTREGVNGNTTIRLSPSNEDASFRGRLTMDRDGEVMEINITETTQLLKFIQVGLHSPEQIPDIL